MGNCQAVDAATILIQHPNGKTEKLYAPVTASHVMKLNPGHHVALLLSTTTLPPPPSPPPPPSTSTNTNTNNTKTNNTISCVRLTRIKLLKPTDTLVLGHVYRLITSQEVMRGLNAKKQAKMKKNQSESAEKIELEKNYGVTRNARIQPKTISTSSSSSSKSATSRPRTTTWQPSLNTISEVTGN